MSVAFYTPEMGERRPADAVIDASLGHYGKHWYIKTPLVLKGRGVEYLGTLTADELVPQARHKVGWHSYKVTCKAMDRIAAEHKTACESLLD